MHERDNDTIEPIDEPLTRRTDDEPVGLHLDDDVCTMCGVDGRTLAGLTGTISAETKYGFDFPWADDATLCTSCFLTLDTLMRHGWETPWETMTRERHEMYQEIMELFDQ